MNLLGKANDPKFWAEIKNKPEFKRMLDLLVKEYQKDGMGQIPCTKFSEFRLFNDIGDRTIYQVNFFKRQHRMFTLTAMTLIFDSEPKYLEQLQDTIWEICDQYVWALPAHMPNITENNNCELDLDSTTIGYALALIKVLLNDRLHDLIKARIDAEIDRRIVKPFLEKRWHWEFRENNWTTVCSGAVGCTLMLNRPEVFDLVMDRINHNMQTYIDNGYRDDGVCTEGAGYWSYGFGYYLTYAEMLKTYTEGRVDLTKGEKVKNIAMFLQKLFLDENVVVNYGDCGVGSQVSMPAGYLYLLKTLFPDDVELPPQNIFAYEVHYFTYFLNTFRFYNPSFESAKLSKNAEYFMADQGWYVKRTEKYGFACRGGSNGESHNHNDVGSFILSKNDKQVLCDIGGRPYTRQYFEHPQRYTFLETSSRGHNVPIINGKYQGNGGKRAITTFENGIVKIDFACVYYQDELKKLVRSFAPDENGVTITDEFDGVHEFTERLVSHSQPKIEDGKITVDGVTITFDKYIASARVEVETHALQLDINGEITEGIPTYLISIDVREPKDKFTFRIDA
ncbi:MAG: heparinase II/III family protein [Clostridia bacterium]|nr:heparinase II/III family protein [Clostridia bacterium]